MTRRLASRVDVSGAGRVDTREMLLLEAIHLFAEHGVDRISLKSISDAAGNRNKSAVGYYFESKQGLVDAVLRRIDCDLAPRTGLNITAFEAAIARGDMPSLSEVVLGLLEPVMLLYATTTYGRDALRVLARMMHDPIANIPADLRKSSDQLIERAIAILHQILPDKPRGEMQHHVHHAIMATVNGLAMQQRFIARGESRWSRTSLADIFLSYAGYVAAGIAGRPLTLDPATDVEWRNRMNEPAAPP